MEGANLRYRLITKSDSPGGSDYPATEDGPPVQQLFLLDGI
jgi:hypothetical protein